MAGIFTNLNQYTYNNLVNNFIILKNCNFRGLLNSPAKTVDRFFSPDLTEHLFGNANGIGSGT